MSEWLLIAQGKELNAIMKALYPKLYISANHLAMFVVHYIVHECMRCQVYVYKKNMWHLLLNYGQRY